jgi:hypothetical protein
MKDRRFALAIVLLIVAVLVATVQAQKYTNCASCLSSGIDPWVCYLTYGAGCL